MNYFFEPDKVKLHRIVDGDTFEIEIDLGFRMMARQMFRLWGCDTPEIYRPKSDAELELGRKAKDFVEKMMTENLFSLLSLSKDPGIYGRWVGIIRILIDGKYVLLSDLLKQNQLTKEYVKHD